MILSLKNLIIGSFISTLLIFSSSYSYAKDWTNDVLIKDLKSKISKIYNISEADVLIEWKDDSLDKKILDLQKIYPNKVLELEIKENTLKDISGKKGIPLNVNIDGKQNRIIYIRCDIDVLKDTLVIATSIKKGEEITEDKIKSSKIPIHKIPKFMYIDDIEKIKGKIAVTDIKDNSVITSNLLKEKFIVFRGNQVTIRVRNGDLTLTGVGEALQDGYKGQNISVKVTSFPSKRTVMAKVLDDGLVEVVLGGSN
ncbi:MAG: flagellar basal body P-ring formation chaperone FlgA [Candidatus Sericytochromatia bacterium]